MAQLTSTNVYGALAVTDTISEGGTLLSAKYAPLSHAHPLTLTSGGSSATELSANTTYTLTAGGNSIVFKTPADNNTTYQFAEGTANGTIGVGTNGGTKTNISVHGLGSNAYNSTAIPTSAGDIGAVPATRTVNGKELSSDISLTASDVGAQNLFRYGGTGGTTKIKIKINSTTTWMLCFTVTLYQGYRATKVMISGYQYGSNHWYQPEATILGDSDGTETIKVYFGYDSTNNLWVGFDGGNYTGVSISDVTNGYTQLTNFDGLFTISNVSSLSTLQTTVTAESKANYANSAGAGWPTTVSSFTNDAGYITSYVDTKNTAGGDNTTSKIFLVGMTSQTTSSGSNQTYSNSNVYATNGALSATSFTATSSRKAKKDITPTSITAIDIINDTEIVDFKFKDDKDEVPHVGFIAEDTNPLLSTPEQDKMDYTNCIGVLLKAVQELSAKVENLEKKINELEK